MALQLYATIYGITVLHLLCAVNYGSPSMVNDVMYIGVHCIRVEILSRCCTKHHVIFRCTVCTGICLHTHWTECF